MFGALGDSKVGDLNPHGAQRGNKNILYILEFGTCTIAGMVVVIPSASNPGGRSLVREESRGPPKAGR